MSGSIDSTGMGDERRDDGPDERRADDYSSARIGAAAALTLVLVVLLVLDVAVAGYDINRASCFRFSAPSSPCSGSRSRPSGGV